MNASESVFAVLDDACAAAAVVEISTALAQLLNRRLQLVYVESAAALAASELSATRVLAQAATQWARFAPPDVELAWRAHALRLRALAERVSQPRAVAWSLRVTRGALHRTALALLPETDLLFVGGAAATFAPGRAAPRRRVIAALDDGGPAGQQALEIAERLCAAIGARLQVQRVDPAHGAPAPPAQADLLVVPTTLVADERLIAALRGPVLLVGRDGSVKR